MLVIYQGWVPIIFAWLFMTVLKHWDDFQHATELGHITLFGGIALVFVFRKLNKIIDLLEARDK